MSYYDEYYDDPFFDITITDCADEVNTVSLLRHYLNCWGITKKLLQKVKPLNEEQIEEIANFCKGSEKIKDLKKNYKSIIESAKEFHRNKEIQQIQRIELIEDLQYKRHDFCGLSMRKIKLLLNKLSKTNNLAKAFRLALEIEDNNISAKNSYWKYEEYIYYKKYQNILKLVEVCKENNYLYGIQESDVPAVSHIIYFELPNCEQISFHTDIETPEEFPKYEKKWDGKVNSTLNKLEVAIYQTFKEEIDKKK